MRRATDMDDEIAIIDALVDGGHLPWGERGRVIDALAAAPGRAQWGEFLWTAGLGIGTALVLSGVMYLVAFNWDQLGIVLRLGMMFTALLGCVLGAIVAGPRSLPGQMCTTGAAVLAGSALVVYSQVYQSGADPWELFASWTVLSLPFVLAARTPALWALLVVLVDVTFGTWLPVSQWAESREVLVLTGFAVGHVILGEAFRGQWLQHVLRVAGAAVLTTFAASFAAEGRIETSLAFAVVVVVGAAVQAAYLFGRAGGAAATLTWAALACTAIAAVVGWLPMPRVGEGSWFLMMGTLVATLTGSGFVWLVGRQRVAARWVRP